MTRLVLAVDFVALVATVKFAVLNLLDRRPGVGPLSGDVAGPAPSTRWSEPDPPLTDETSR